MKPSLIVLALLATAAGADAAVRVFVTGSNNPYGLEDNANAFLPTVSTVYANGVDLNGYDYWADSYGTVPGPIRVGAFPPADSPSGTTDSPVLIPTDEFAYIWLQFQNEPNGAKINALQVTIREYGSSTPADVPTTYYLGNNKSNVVNNKRWEGPATPPGYPEWHNNPQTMVAIAPYGLGNLDADLPWNLWQGGTSRIALLGAVTAPFDLTLYEILITNISYPGQPPPAQDGGFFAFLPEPASALLLALPGMLIRRKIPVIPRSAATRNPA